MKKKDLTEADIRSKFITPALVGSTGGENGYISEWMIHNGRVHQTQ